MQMKSHYDELKNNPNSAFIAFETIPKESVGHTKVNIHNQIFNLPNYLTLLGTKTSAQILEPFTSWNTATFPNFIDFRLNKLYNNLIKDIYLYIKVASSANSTIIPFSLLINKIEISRSTSVILQTINADELFFFNQLTSSPAFDKVDNNTAITLTTTLNNANKKCYINLPTIFSNNCFLDKFNQELDIVIRVFFKDVTKMLTVASTNQDSTKLSLSECKLVFDLTEIPNSTYNMLKNNDFLDYVTVVPQQMTFYTPNLVANNQYELNMTTFKNSCVGFCAYVKANSNNNDDQYTYGNIIDLQIKNQNGNEITNKFDIDLLRALNVRKINDSWKIVSGLNWLFFCDKVYDVLNNNYIDGCMSFAGDDKRICVTFGDAFSNVYIMFLKIVLLRVTNNDILVLNS